MKVLTDLPSWLDAPDNAFVVVAGYQYVMSSPGVSAKPVPYDYVAMCKKRILQLDTSKIKSRLYISCNMSTGLIEGQFCPAGKEVSLTGPVAINSPDTPIFAKNSYTFVLFSGKGLTTGDYGLKDKYRKLLASIQLADPGFLSAPRIYDVLALLGAKFPGRIQELSYFSHGYPGGPVLANSSDAVPPYKPPTLVVTPAMAVPRYSPDTGRIMGDLDPRPYDFAAIDSTVSDKQKRIKQIASAFATAGVIWLWGCAQNLPIYLLLKVVRADRNAFPTLDHADSRITVRLPGTKDIAVFSKGLKMSLKDALIVFASYYQNWPGLPAALVARMSDAANGKDWPTDAELSGESLRIPWYIVVANIRRMNGRYSYAQAIHENLGRSVVFAPVPGYTDHANGNGLLRVVETIPGLGEILRKILSASGSNVIAHQYGYSKMMGKS